jgi:hypothetical protein
LEESRERSAPHTAFRSRALILRELSQRSG